MKTAKFLPAVAAVVVTLVSPLSFADNADFRFSAGDVMFGIVIGTPPPPMVEYVPVAVPGYVWVPGYRAWHGHRHVWTRGGWEKSRHERYEGHRDHGFYRDGDGRRNHYR